MVRERLFVPYQRIRLSSPFLRWAVNVVPGAARLHRFLFALIRPREITLDVRGLSMTVDSLDAVLGAHLIRDGVWEPYETEVFERSIRSGMVVADVGANIGYYTLLAARAVGPRGRVISFEPDPRNVELLRRNVAANGFDDRVTVVAAAVGDRSGTATLFRDAHNFGAHSLAEANTSTGAPLGVPCTTLDDSLRSEGARRVDILKIDTQGAEGKVFAGAVDALSRGPMLAFAELWPQGLREAGADPSQLLDDLAARFGFRIWWIDQQHQRLVEVSASRDLLLRCEGGNHLDLLLERA